LVPTSFFTIQSVSKNSSILDFWVTEPSFDRTSGTVNFEGVALSGFKGDSGVVATMKLKPIKTGTGRVLFQSGKILANDGEGTDITQSLNGATFSLVEPVVKPKPVLEEKEEVVIPQPLPSLKAPEIMSGFKDGKPSIIGSSDYSLSQVLLTFVDKEGSKVFITGEADMDGGFNINVPSSLKHGDYGVSAIMIDKDKKNSERSNLIVIKVGNIFSDLGREVIVLILLLIFTVLYLLLRTFHHFKNRKSERKNIKNEVKEAEYVAHKTFDILREDLDSLEEEKTVVGKRKIASEIKKDIDKAEEVLEKEIKDIGSL
jgi:hypothetical protein